VPAQKLKGNLLLYIDQTEKICLEEVRRNGLALRFVEKQTPEICLAAVKQNGFALNYVKERTPEIVIEAYRNIEACGSNKREDWFVTALAIASLLTWGCAFSLAVTY
jgi:hypothetical protein